MKILKNQVYFIYEKEIEYLLAAIEMLNPYERNSKIREAYDEAFITAEKEKYPLFFEVFQNMNQRLGLEIFEGILEYGVEDFSLEKYFGFLKELPREKFLSMFLQMPETRMIEARKIEEAAFLFYKENKELFSSFYAVETLFQKTDWFLDSFYKFVSDLKTEKAEQVLKKYEQYITDWEERIVDEIDVKDIEPLELSEQLMGKTFFNRGPYSKFYFVPSVFMPMKCCRWHSDYQIFIFDAVRMSEIDKKSVPEQFKVFSDKTRYQILVLLKEKTHMNGIEIAKEMKLATSTVSHHMTQLKNCGLVHEEMAANTKYYSLNIRMIKECINLLEETFLRENSPNL